MATDPNRPLEGQAGSKDNLEGVIVQLKEQNKGTKGQTKILEGIAASLAGPSASQQAEMDQEGKKVEKGGDGGGGKGFGGIGKMFKGIMKFVNMIKKGVLFLLLPAILLFLNSPFFKKALTFIQDTLLPALKRVWEWLKTLFTDPMQALKDLWDGMLDGAADIGAFLWEKGIKPFWDWITDLWKGMDWAALWKGMLKGATDIGSWIWDKAIKPFWTWITGIFKDIDWGSMWTGLWGAFTSIGTWIWDKAIKPFWTWIKGIFTFKSSDAEDEDSKKGVLGYIKDLAIGIWEWFKDLFDFSTIGSTFASIVNLITLPYNILLGLVQGVWKWFKGLFGWEEAKTAEAEVDTKPGGIGGMLLSLIQGVWGWFKGLFGWGKDGEGVKPAEDEDSKKGILGFLSDIVTGVWTWFKGLFQWGETTSTPAESEDSKKGVKGFLLDMVTGIWGWFKGLFDFSSFSAGLISAAKLLFLPYTALFDMIDAIWTWFKGLMGFSSEDADKDPRSGSEKVIDFVIALPGKIWAWLKKTVLGWFGLAKEEDKIVAEVADAEKPEEGWISKLFSAIFPEWLLHPVDWIMKKLGLKDAEGKLTEKGTGFQDLVIAEGGIGAAIGKIFSQIFPEWITSPISWIKGKLGLTGDDAAKKDTWKFPGFPTVDDLLAFLPKWLTDPVGWVKSFFSDDDDSPQAQKAKLELEMKEHRKKISEGDNRYGAANRLSRENRIKDIEQEMMSIQDLHAGGNIGKGALSIVGEKGPEFFIPKSRGTVIPNDVSQTASLLAMGAGGGGGGSTTNVSINAPTNANTTSVSNTTENVMGASDPYVGVAGAFG